MARGKPAPVQDKNLEAFKTISETADMLSLPQHVLRFWESKFGTIKPLKLRGGRRYYRPQDIEALLTIKHLLYKEGYTIKGAKRAINHNRRKDAPMPVEKPAKRRKTEVMDDAPLFAALEPAPVPRKDELKKIHGELLELRAMIGSLPPLNA